MNKTDERIKNFHKQGCSNERIAKKLGRILTDELEERINKCKHYCGVAAIKITKQ